MFVEVTGPTRDLHSGVFGRTVHEPMTTLIALLGKLVAQDGTILVPGVDDMVHSADDEEKYEDVKPSFSCRWLTYPRTGHFTIVSTTPLLTSTMPSVHQLLYQMIRSRFSWAG